MSIAEYADPDKLECGILTLPPFPRCPACQELQGQRDWSFMRAYGKCEKCISRSKTKLDEDARSEGITVGGCLNCGTPEPCSCPKPEPSAKDAFFYGWNTIYKKKGLGLDVNPWVWAITFRRIEP